MSGSAAPGRVARRVLLWAARRLDTPEVESTADEVFAWRVERDGLAAARRWYRRQARIALVSALRTLTPSAGDLRSPRLATLTHGAGREVRHASRRLAGRPVRALTFCGIVGVGIALAVFAVQARTDMLYPDDGLPMESRQVVWLTEQGEPRPLLPLSGTEAWLDDPPDVLAAIAVIWPSRAAVDTPGGLLQVPGERVLPGHFRRLGAQAWLGRDLEGPGEVVLSHGLWTARFGSDTEVLDRLVGFDGEPVRVVGVGAPGFNGPLCCVPPGYWKTEESEAPRPARVLAVGTRGPELAEAWFARVVGVAFPGVQPALDHPAAHPLGGTSGFVGRVLAVLVSLAIVVWVSTLFSGANLLISDTLRRAPELRLRRALGAPRGQVVAGVAAESGLLALGAAAFAVLSAGLMTVIAPWLLPIIGSTSTIRVSLGAEALWVTAVAAPFSALLCAAPAMVVAARLARSASVEGGRGRSGRRSSSGVGLVVQLALAGCLVLVTGRFLEQLERYDGDFVGFRNGATAVHFVSDSGGEDAPSGRALVESVESGTSTLRLALSRGVPVYGARQDSIELGGGERMGVAFERVTEGYFDLLGTHLLQGAPASTDAEVVVSSDIAMRMGGNAVALGRTVVLGDSTALRVTGVVEAATWGTGEVLPSVYRGWGSAPVGSAALLVSARDSGVGDLLEALRPFGVALRPFETLDGLLVRRRVVEVFLARLATAFGLAALLVAAGAVHAHFLRWVVSRQPELAVRAALGAAFPALGRHVVVGALLRVLPGIALGLLAGLGAGRLVGAYLGPIGPTSPGLVLLAIAVVLGSSMLALAGPVLRIRRTEPLSLFRAD